MSQRGRGPAASVQARPEVELPQERVVPEWLASISEFLLSVSNIPVFLGAISFTALLGYNVSRRADSLKETSSLPLLGFRTSYTSEAIYELFADLGPEGRAEYSTINLMSAGVGPALLALCLSISIGQIFKKAGLPHVWNLLPFLYLIMSLFENAGIAYLLYAFPTLEPNVGAVVGVFAGFKFRILLYSVLSIVLGFLWLLKTVLQKRLFKKRD